MKNLTALIISLLFATPSFATTQADIEKYIGNPDLFKQPMLICTRDLNEWGKASVCNTCPDGTAYDKRIGQCAAETTGLTVIEGAIETVKDEDGDITGYVVVIPETGETVNLVTTRSLKAELADKDLDNVALTLEGEIVSTINPSDKLMKKPVEHFVVVDEAFVRSQIEKLVSRSASN